MSPENRPAAELVDAGVLAYRHRDYKSAMRYLQSVVDEDPQNWRARLYLGMSFFHSGDEMLAGGQFRALTLNCTDEEILRKAQAALTAMNGEAKTTTSAPAAMPDMSCTIKLPSSFVKQILADALDEPEIEWVPIKASETTTT